MKPFIVMRREQAARQEFHWGTLYWYADGQAGNATRLTFGKCVLDPGAANPEHMHPNCEEVLHVLTGQIRHVADDETVEMGPGDTLTIRPGVYHHAENLGDTPAEMMIAFSTPHRKTESR